MVEEGSALEIILQQIETLLIFAQRPVLQRQIAVVGLVFALAAGLTIGVRRRLAGGETWQVRVLALNQLFAPLVGLLLGYGALVYFNLQDYPTGLLNESLYFFWVWLGYRTLLVLLYARFGEAVAPYHKWILAPLFFLIVAARIFSSLVNLRLLADITLLAVGETRVTLGALIAAVIVLYWILILAWVAEKGIERGLTPRLHSEPGLINTVSTITRYTIIGVAILATLLTLGIDLSALAIIGGGLSIGIGIGLQQIVANFFSGLVLIFEQALRPGDVIELEGQLARVEKINMRATTIRTIDNVEIIVPNENFLTNAVTTYTKTDRRVRVMVPFGVSYDCDPNLVRRLALQTAAEHEMVLSDPPPSLLFRAFGESSMDFELAVWMDRPARRARLRSDLYYLLWDVFAENKIELPFPQRDIHIKGGPEAWRALAQTDPAQDAPHESDHMPGGGHPSERGRPAASGDIAESSGDSADASDTDGENDWLGDDPSGR